MSTIFHEISTIFDYFLQNFEDVCSKIFHEISEGLIGTLPLDQNRLSRGGLLKSFHLASFLFRQ